MIMLKNRFMRLLTTIIFSAVLIVGASAIEIISTNFDWEWNIPDGSIFFTTMLTVAVCLVGQFFGDIMDVDGWFNNLFVTILKRVLFFAVALGALFIGAGFTLGGSLIERLVNHNASVLEIGVTVSCMISGAFAFALYMFGYVKYGKDGYRKDGKRWLPFFLPISFVASILTSILVAFIVDVASMDPNLIPSILGIIELLLVAVSILVSYKTEIWVFDEEDAYVYSTSSSRGGSSTYTGSTYYNDETPTPTVPEIQRDCKNCAYYSRFSPITDQLGDYCYYHKKPLGYFDDPCEHYVE